MRQLRGRLQRPRTAELLHGRALRVLQQRRTHRRSRRCRPAPDYASSGIRYKFAFLSFSGARRIARLRPHPRPQHESQKSRITRGRLQSHHPAHPAPVTRNPGRCDPGGLPARLFRRRRWAATGGGVGVSGGSTNVNTIDPDSYFRLRRENRGLQLTYKYLGEKQMLACVHAKFSARAAMSLR